MTIGPETSRAKAAAASRAKVLTSAKVLFERYGYDAVTMRQIARHIGMSTGVLFSHFAGKEELFEEATGRKVPMAVIKDMLVGAAERGEVPGLGAGAAAVLLRDLYGSPI